MKRLISLAFAAITTVAFSPSFGAEPRTVPERLVVAQYVALGIDLGDRVVAAEELIPDARLATRREREALEEIRQRLQSWDRFVVVNRLADAELLLVVRQGRKSSIGGGGGAGGAVPPVSVGTARPAFGGTFYSPDDMLAVYDASGSPSTPLWRMAASKGLNGEIPLFEAFRADVEGAAGRP